MNRKRGQGPIGIFALVGILLILGVAIAASMDGNETSTGKGIEISSISIEMNEDSATISWETNAEADSLVKYGLSESVVNEAGTSALEFEHEIILENLDAGRTYYYQIISCDSEGDCANTETALLERTTMQEEIIEEMPAEIEEILTEEQIINETADETIVEEIVNESSDEIVVEENITEEIIINENVENITETIEEENKTTKETIVLAAAEHGIYYYTQSGTVLQPGAEGKDTQIDSINANKNYGASTSIDVNSAGGKRILMEFDLSSVPSGAILTNATLRLYMSNKGTGSIPITIQRINNSWTEGTGTATGTDDGASWNTRNGTLNWDVQGGDFGTTIWANTTVSDANLFYNWDITNLVKNWANGSHPNYGMIIRAGDGSGVWSFDSSDNINSTRWPMLNITYSETTAPTVNIVQIPSVREGNDIGLDANISDNEAVNSALFEFGGVNYSMSSGGASVDKVVQIIPAAKGLIESGSIDDHKDAYDRNNLTTASIEMNSKKLMVRTPGISAAGTVNSITINVLYSTKSTNNVPCAVHWAVSSGVQGIVHEFTANNTMQFLSVDITSERSWSLSDFNNVEIHVNKTGDTALIHEVWFEVNYTSSASADFWNATIPTSELAAGVYNYTIYANDTSNNRMSHNGNFTISPKLVLVNATVENVTGNVQQAHIEIYDSGNELELNETSNESILTSVEAGNKTILIEPLNNPIDSMEFNSVSITSDVADFIKVDDASENGTGLGEVYSIDPTALNFTNATIKVTASGNDLFKCTLWDAETQTCNGRWKKLADIIPGQEYNFTLTPEDPGFGETNTTITLVDENSYLIETNETIVANNSGVLDVNVTILNNTLKAKKLSINGHDESTGNNDMIVISNVNLNDNRLKGSSSFEAGNLSFTNYSVALNTTGKKSFECTNWNATTQNCTGEWRKVNDHQIGEVYEHVITEADKAVAESAYNISILDNSFNLLQFNETNITRDGELVDAEYELRGLKIKKIKIYRKNESAADDEIILQQDRNLSELSGFYERTVQIDPNITFDYAEIYINATSNYLYKCLDWNISGEVCNAGWRRLQTLTPNEEYLLTLTPGDPVFLESNKTISVFDADGNEMGNVNATVISDENELTDFQLDFESSVVEHILIDNYNYSTNSTILRIDDAPENASGLNSSDVYAIDPTQLSAANITITITANASTLYKCPNWNFTTKTCVDGVWVTLLSGMTIGQEYNITINSTDPGFAEQPGGEGKDAYIDSGQQNRNFGAGATIDMSTTDSKRALIEFNLTDIPANSTITNATVTFYLVSKGIGASVPITIQRVNNSWDEGTGTGQITMDGTTWINRSGTQVWDVAGGDFGTTIWANTTVSTQDLFYDWDITNLVQNWINGSYPNHGMILRAGDGDGTWKLSSSDEINATRRPQISITYGETTAPVINSVNMPSELREGSNLSLTVNATDNTQVSNVRINVGNANYSLSQSAPTGSQLITIRPAAKGTIETNRIINYQNTYDNNNDTYAGVNNNLLLALKTSGVSAVGTINSVKIKVLHTKAYYNTTGYVQWAIDLGTQGTVHEFNSTSEDLTYSEFDVTAERAWTFADFNLLAEIHINNSDNILRVYETWFEVNYTAPSSNDFWIGGLDTTGWTTGVYNYSIVVNDTSNNIGNQSGNFTLLPRLVTVNTTVENATGAMQESYIAIYNSNSELEFNETLNESLITSIDAGTKTIVVEPADNIIQRIEFGNITVNSDAAGIVEIENPSDNQGWTELYSINPLVGNATNNETYKVTATAAAGSNILYKCPSWNFTTQTCVDNDWIAWADIRAGEEYNASFIVGDPGLAEGNATFFDGFESGSLVTNNWTNTGTGVAWIISTSGTYSGSYSIKAETTVSESIVQTNVSTLTYKDINVSFYTRTEKLDNGEYVAADWYNGSAWINLLSVEDVDPYTLYSYTLSSDANNNPNFKIRFRCLSSSPNELCRIDNVLITGVISDIEKPIMNFTSPTETSGSLLSRNNLLVNVTANDTNLANVTIRLYNSTGLVNSSTSTSSPFYLNFTGLANGNYSFNATAYDLYGNFNSTETRNVTIDSTAPNATILAPQNATITNVTSQNFTLNVSDNNGLANATLYIYNETGLYNQTTVSLGGATQSVIGVVVNLVSGVYSWFWQVIDLAGNLFSTASTSDGNRTITIDTINPQISIVSPENITYNTDSVFVNYSTSDLNGISACWYKVDGSGNIALPGCTTTSLSGLTDDSHTIIVYANDSAGNVNSSNVTFSIDTTPPFISIVSPLNANYTNATIVVNLTSTGDYTWFNNGTANVSYSSPTYLTFPQGSTILTAYTNDSVGNVNSTSVVFFVDSTYPAINFTSPTETSESILNISNILVNVTANDTNLANITIRLYNSTGLYNSSVSASSPFFLNFTGLRNGNYSFNATAYDLYGNFNSTGTRNITIDSTAPNASILAPQNATITNVTAQNFTLNVSDNNGLANATLYIYNSTGLYNQTTVSLGGATQSVIGVVVNLVSGVYSWFWTVIDLAGNLFGTATTEEGNRTITIDTINPQITINSPLNTTYTNATILVNLTSTGDYTLFDNGTTVESYTTPIYRTFPEGSTTLAVYTNDTAGNANSTSVMFFVDTVKPASVTDLSNQSAGSTWIYWNWTNPADADFDEAIVFVDSVNVANTSNNYYNATGLNAHTTYTITVHTIDALGNVNDSDVNSTAETLNTIPVASNVQILPSTAYTNNSLTCNYTYSDADGDAEAGVSFAWFNNSILQEDFIGQNVTSGNTTKGESWKCRVIVNDGLDNGTAVNSSALVISNFAPFAVNLTLNSSEGNNRTNETLIAGWNFFDIDAGDSQVTYTTKWYKNGAEQAALEDVTEVTAGNTTKGDIWRFSVKVFDGTSWDGWINSSNITIVNSAPSKPVITILPSSPTDGDDLVASLTTPSVDNDDDSITYTYKWYKNAVLQAGVTTNTVSRVLTTVGENWSVAVIPNDGTVNGINGTDSKIIAGDLVVPISLISPADGTTWTSSNSVAFYYNVSELVNNCSLMIDSAVAQTDTTVSANATQSFTQTVSNGNYQWKVNCSFASDNATNATSARILSVSYSAPAPSGGGGGGGGGGSVTRTTNVTNVTVGTETLSAKIEIKQTESAILNAGESKKISINARNSGTSYLESCRIKGGGNYASWITSDSVKDIIPGQSVDFIINMNVPAETKPGAYTVNFALSCQGIEKQSSISLEVISKKLAVSLIDAHRENSNIVVIYSLEELAGQEQDVNVEIVLFGSNNARISETSESRTIGANSKQQYETSFIIPADIGGNLNLLINANSPIASAFVQEYVIIETELPTRITGLSLLSNEKYRQTLIIWVAIVSFLVFAFFVFRRIFRYRGIHGRKHIVSSMVRQITHGKHYHKG